MLKILLTFIFVWVLYNITHLSFYSCKNISENECIIQSNEQYVSEDIFWGNRVSFYDDTVCFWDWCSVGNRERVLLDAQKNSIDNISWIPVILFQALLNDFYLILLVTTIFIFWWKSITSFEKKRW